MNAELGLTGRRVLVIEDDWLVASETTRVLQAAGADVVGPAGSVETALALINSSAPIDAALVDINLKGEMAFTVADLLLERSIPMCFVSGYPPEVAPERHRHLPFCDKPVDVKQAARLLFGD